MIILIPFIIFMASLIVAVGLEISCSRHEATQGFSTVIAVVIAVVSGAFLIISGFVFLAERSLHIDQLAEYRTNAVSVQIFEKQVVRLKEICNSKQEIIADNKSLLTANNDTPVASVVQQLASTTEDLMNAELRKNALRTEIMARKMGWYSFIVKWYGEE